MANQILFMSAIANTFIHSILFLLNPPSPLFGYILCFGLSTSLLNHGMTNVLAKYGDRLAMIIGLTFDLMVSYQQEAYIAFIGLYLSVACYALSKLFDQVEFHVLSHIVLTGVHMILIS